MQEDIFVTRPELPPLADFVKSLETLWDSRLLTNNGSFHQAFETELAEYLGVKYVSLFANGTLALLTALQVLRINGEVITTPYTFAATTHALHWNQITPVFCDIDPWTLNLDPNRIESLITPRTTAILPVHIYGIPCDVAKIEDIADVYGLKVIYDACHAFGVKVKNESILTAGDLSVLSFHATKIFTTMEGGAIVTNDLKVKKRIDYLKNFGFSNEVHVIAPGINGKMNEMQAALGLLQLKYIDGYIASRRQKAMYYREHLRGLRGLRLMEDFPDVTHNYPYFPVFISQDEFGASRDAVYHALRDRNIYSRRYFYPLTSAFPMYRNSPSAAPENLPIANVISSQVLCLPLFPDLHEIQLDRIIRTIKDTAK
ncbi:MAG: DegT/DnrJ/EryC1/StrS family aminotransferase [Deltaproteobacteria bacterium]|nr:DegT/DnrJ/EryC1/StrS family aminotransferase [Deltaproteobacteria bacterium]